jgi:hypothetical protein
VAAGLTDKVMAQTSVIVALLSISAASCAGCSGERIGQKPGAAADSREGVPRNATLAAGPAAGHGSAAAAASLAPDSGDAQWTIPAKNYASTRYSGLAEITAANVAGLKLAWTFSTGVDRGHEAAPLVVGSTMYVVTPYPNTLYALDLAQPAQVEIRAAPGGRGAGRRVLRCRQPGRGLCRRQDHLQHLGCAHRGGGRRDRT